jgi:protein gp37
MAENTAIEWCDHTFNPWVGCTKVSPACDHCYAESWAKRSGSVQWGVERRRTTPTNWRKPIQWQAKAAEFQALHGRRQRVFCASLADVFDNQVPDQWRDDLWTLIDYTRDLDWLLLTKRISNVGNMLPLPFDFAEKFPHVWIGATICNQAEADRDIPKLLEVDARVRFLSIEPMLGPIDLERPKPGPDLNQGSGSMICQPWLIQSGIDWVIVGGESGPSARPMHPDWARSLRDQCALAGVPFLFKQWGEHLAGELCPHPDYADDAVSAWRLDQAGRRWHDPLEGLKPISQWAPIKFTKAGKKTAGRLLDGIEHNAFPERRHA